MTPSKPHIAIIGAGIGGLTAASCLRRVGIDVRIYEQARGFTRLGAGIQQAPNAIRVLYALGLKEKPAASPTRFPWVRASGSATACRIS
jgi:2-polyprenyl-6-methoxyphenol hydroxylase-like FAD-dependent oxidoreductase